MSDKIGALVIDLQGFQLSAEEKELLAHPLVGGVILFTRNYDNQPQPQELCRTIRHSRQKPLLIMADQEGGRVQRFRNDFFPHPPLSFFGKCYDKNPDLALELSRAAGWLMASEILTSGLDLSLAPVVDINKSISSVIGDRAFHAEKEIVFLLAKAYIESMHEAGMAATIKHFPGHGSVQADSHLDTPVYARELNEILEDDIQPFKQLIQANIKAVMAAHIIFPAVDALQVSFSRIWLQNILRGQLGFQGVIFSDDLNMQGANISSDYSDRVMAAHEAGCDFTLLCNNRQGVIEVIDRLSPDAYQVSAQKWRAIQADLSRKSEHPPRVKLASDFLQKHMNAMQQESLTNTQ